MQTRMGESLFWGGLAKIDANTNMALEENEVRINQQLHDSSQDHSHTAISYTKSEVTKNYGNKTVQHFL